MLVAVLDGQDFRNVPIGGVFDCIYAPTPGALPENRDGQWRKVQFMVVMTTPLRRTEKCRMYRELRWRPLREEEIQQYRGTINDKSETVHENTH
jgi:hypothetical protein